LDRRLKNAAEGIGSLALEVRGGEFLEKLPHGTAKAWACNGLVLATKVLGVEESPSNCQSTPFTIVTSYASEAGALLDRIHALFMPLLDECIEHDFLDRIGEATLEYCGYADPSQQTAINMLKIILSEAESILDEMLNGEFPYTTNGAT
jgi:hypothetical protein